MNRSSKIVVALAVLLSTSIYQAQAKKGNEPSKGDAEDLIIAAGAPHYFSNKTKIKVRDCQAVEIDKDNDIYYYVFNVTAKDREQDIDENRLAVFSPEAVYMGFYAIGGMEMSGSEEGGIYIDLGDGGDDGGGDEEVVPIPEGGPSKTISINGMSYMFIKAVPPKKEEVEGAEDVEKKPLEYREWTLTVKKGKVVPVRALFVKIQGNPGREVVFLKSEAMGTTKEFPLKMFSEADLEYIKSVNE